MDPKTKFAKIILISAYNAIQNCIFIPLFVTKDKLQTWIVYLATVKQHIAWIQTSFLRIMVTYKETIITTTFIIICIYIYIYICIYIWIYAYSITGFIYSNIQRITMFMSFENGIDRTAIWSIITFLHRMMSGQNSIY